MDHPTAIAAPDLMPELSPGRHRSPRRGACFMEFASYLAGEKWSDHPSCTHPMLASLARMVNDFTSDHARSRLAPLIPRVVGLSGDDPSLGLRIVVHAAAAAMPVASLERQRALAVGLLSCLRIADSEELELEIRDALECVPDGERWARQFVQSHELAPEKHIYSRGGEAIIRVAVIGIAYACVPDADERLHALLERAISDCENVRPIPAPAPLSPVALSRLVGV